MVKEKEKRSKEIFTTGKRRRAVARAKVSAGSGQIFINSVPLELWGNEPLRLWIKEPLILAGDVAARVDIKVSTRGGGIAGQAEAARMAIARGLVEFSGDKNLREKFMQYDRNLLVYDPRRNEPHHAGGASKRGSRRHKQRSKR
jgi:small subunit ribosomal protein S9